MESITNRHIQIAILQFGGHRIVRFDSLAPIYIDAGFESNIEAPIVTEMNDLMEGKLIRQTVY